MAARTTHDSTPGDAHATSDARSCACSRRVVLKGLGSLAMGVSLTSLGCSASGSQLGMASTKTCGTGVCMDLTDSANAALTKVGGAMIVDTPAGNSLVVIRTTADTVVALSAVCTHRGCIVDFDASQHLIVCPCHGSEFSQDGQVVRGPAQRALGSYTATLSGNQLTIATG